MFFFNATTTTDIYTLSLHDALPILKPLQMIVPLNYKLHQVAIAELLLLVNFDQVDLLIKYEFYLRTALSSHYLLYLRSEEHTSELQSQFHLVCRLLLEKKKTK